MRRCRYQIADTGLVARPGFGFICSTAANPVRERLVGLGIIVAYD
jgi:hypothetical protein